MIKNIIFDSGGVIVNYRGTLHSELVAKLFSLPLNKAQEIWQNNRDRITIGETTTKDLLGEIRRELKSEQSTAQLYQRWKSSFEDAVYEIDQKVVDLIKLLKEKYRVYMLTNIFDTTAEHKIHLYLSTIFHQTFRSHELKMKKPDEKIFLHVLKETNSKPQETIFIDDKEENVESAKKLGMKGVVYKDFDQLLRELKNMIDL